MADLPDRVIAPRLWPPAGIIPQAGSPLVLDASESRHLVSVLRAQKGDPVVLFDGSGREARAVVLEVNPRRATVVVESVQERELPSPQIILLQAYPKNRNWDHLLRQCTELGVHEIRVAATRYAQANLARLTPPEKRENWRSVLIEACKQSGNPFLPALPEPATLETHLKDIGPNDLCLLGSLEPGRTSIHTAFSNWSGTSGASMPRRVFLAVGPEGDFSEDEYQMLKSKGFRPIVLGPWVLRVDTAAVAFVASVQSQILQLTGKADNGLVSETNTSRME